MRTLPDGTQTDDATEYVEAWHAFVKPIEEFMGMECMAYDPGALFDFDKTVISLSSKFIMRFNKQLNEYATEAFKEIFWRRS